MNEYLQQYVKENDCVTVCESGRVCVSLVVGVVLTDLSLSWPIFP